MFSMKSISLHPKACSNGVTVWGATNSPLVESSSSIRSWCCTHTSKFSGYRIIGGFAETSATRYLRLTSFFSSSSQSGDAVRLLLVLWNGEMSLLYMFLVRWRYHRRKIELRNLIFIYRWWCAAKLCTCVPVSANYKWECGHYISSWDLNISLCFLISCFSFVTSCSRALRFLSNCVSFNRRRMDWRKYASRKTTRGA